MAADKPSREIVTEPLPDPIVLWLDLVSQMDKLNKAMTRFDVLTDGNPSSHVGQNPPFRNGDPGGGDA